jgi:hypothetical protein
LVTGCIGLLKLVTTINYNTIANSHTLQFTNVRTMASQSAWFLLAGAYLATTLQSSLIGYSSRSYGSRTALPDLEVKTLLLCPWPPSQGPGPPACRPIVSELRNLKLTSQLPLVI